MYPHFWIKSFRNCKMVSVKVFNTEQCLIHVAEKQQKYLDTSGHGSAFLTDFCKAFDSTDHELLIEKVKEYGADTNSLYVLLSYL